MFYPSLASANLPITVLKFGGSVLAGPDALSDVVSEIERTVRGGHRVVAVTSAFAGVTSRLLEKARERFRAPEEKSLAGLLATGESRSAAFVSLALDDAGIRNELLDPDRIKLRVRGAWLDAEPIDVDLGALHEALIGAPVIVLPGFFGRRRDGSYALLGRGGSDLTALFLADRLGARDCRLIKDVDGLFNRDPATGGDELRAFTVASFQELAALGGGLVQAKAIDFAKAHGLEFTIATVASDRGTLIGPPQEAAVRS